MAVTGRVACQGIIRLARLGSIRGMKLGKREKFFFFYQLLLGFDQFSLFNTASDHSDHNAESSVRGTSNTDSETFLDLTDMLGNLFPLVKDDRGYVKEYRQVREGRRIIKSRDLWKKYIYIYWISVLYITI